MVLDPSWGCRTGCRRPRAVQASSRPPKDLFPTQRTCPAVVGAGASARRATAFTTTRLEARLRGNARQHVLWRITFFRRDPRHDRGLSARPQRNRTVDDSLSLLPFAQRKQSDAGDCGQGRRIVRRASSHRDKRGLARVRKKRHRDCSHTHLSHHSLYFSNRSTRCHGCPPRDRS